MARENAGKLSILKGLPETPVFFIKNRFTIGRDIDNSFVISKNLVSRHHARIEWKEKEENFYIFDEGSENGVVVNGCMILGNEQLKTGDTIFISDVEMQFEIVPFSDEMIFEEEINDLSQESLGDELTGTHFMDISELNPDYFEELREQKPKPKWVWDEGPEDGPKKPKSSDKKE
ncbi:MAG: FHA domain-containing protein [Candidatus Aureabacteria bacterium]|nr:FHA domain-containing protein [Candidatus Auribacterota bacterium]